MSAAVRTRAATAAEPALPRLHAYEFFAGGGLARIGLAQAGFDCVFANDIDPRKCAAYRANFGDDGLVEGDIAALTPTALPGRADLAWASFPCQDLSLAGARQGLSGGRSGAFWPFWRLIQALDAEGRGPRVIAIENVVGLVSSGGGRDFGALTDALAASGRVFAALVIDARLFTAQSRPRLFVLAWRGDAPAALRVSAPDPRWTPPPLARTLDALMGAARQAHRPISLPSPAVAAPALSEVVERGVNAWLSDAQMARLIALMAPRHRARLQAASAEARAHDRPVAGALFRRMRPDGAGGRAQRAEIRFDAAGCLRTPAGGSSRQTLIWATPDGRIRARLFTAREAARLMGAPEWYAPPESATAALQLFGDAVAPPAAQFLAERAIRPLIAAGAGE